MTLEPRPEGNECVSHVDVRGEHSRAGSVAGTSGNLESKKSECHEEERGDG